MGRGGPGTCLNRRNWWTYWVFRSCGPISTAFPARTAVREVGDDGVCVKLVPSSTPTRRRPPRAWRAFRRKVAQNDNESTRPRGLGAARATGPAGVCVAVPTCWCSLARSSRAPYPTSCPPSSSASSSTPVNLSRCPKPKLLLPPWPRAPRRPSPLRRRSPEPSRPTPRPPTWSSAP